MSRQPISSASWTASWARSMSRRMRLATPWSLGAYDLHQLREGIEIAGLGPLDERSLHVACHRFGAKHVLALSHSKEQRTPIPIPVSDGSSSRSSPPLAQPLPRVAARAEHTGPRRQWLAPEDERHRMVGRESAGSHRMRLAMPAGTGPAVDRDVRLDRPLRQPSPRRRPPDGMIGRAPEAVGEARPTAAVAATLVRRGPAAGAGVVLAAPTGADTGASHPRPSGLDYRCRGPVG